MPQLYCQLASRPGPWLLGRTSAGLCTLQTACPLTVTYSGGSPAADTIAAGSAATVYGGSAATFDASADVWVVLTVPGSGALQVTKEADLATVTGDWAGLARIVQHSTEPYQPQAYLAAGGVGAGGAPVTLLVPSAAGQGKVLNLGVGGSPPAAWQTAGYDDSAWAAPVAETTGFEGSPISGTAWVTWADGTQASLDAWLLRHHISLPAGTAQAATLQIWPDDFTEAIYINGSALSLTETGSLLSYAVPLADLAPGGDNVLAVHVKNATAGAPNPTSLDYRLSVTIATSAQGASEGALLYLHDGTWQPLPIGMSGQELTVVSGDPAWATPSGGTVTSVQVAVPAPLSASGGPITAGGTITLVWSGGQSANRVLASPDGTTGAVSLRALVGNDIPVDASTIVVSAGTIKGNYQAGSGVSISGNTISATGSGGSVTSVALSVPSSIFSVAGSPITTSGTLAVSLQTQASHTFWAGPASGSAATPTFRALGGSDLPAAAGAGGHIHAHVHLR